DSSRPQRPLRNRLIVRVHTQILSALTPYFFAAASETLLIPASPFSKSPPTILSMSITRQKPFSMNERCPDMLHVTFVPLPSGLNANSAVLVASNGFINSSLICNISAGLLCRIVIRPLPTSLFPSHSDTAPCPLAAPEYVYLQLGSSFAHGDHASHL